jgi:hypothetical protein
MAGGQLGIVEKTGKNDLQTEADRYVIYTITSLVPLSQKMITISILVSIYSIFDVRIIKLLIFYDFLYPVWFKFSSGSRSITSSFGSGSYQVPHIIKISY